MGKKVTNRSKQPDPDDQDHQNYLLNEVENLRSVLGVDDDTQDLKQADIRSAARRYKKGQVKKKK